MRNKYCRIAAAVPRVHLADVVKNKAEMLALVEEGAKKGVSLIVFPSLAMTGATCGDILEHEVILDMAAEAEEELAIYAESLGVKVILGEEDMDEDDGIVIYQDARPELVTSYRSLRYSLALESKGKVVVYCSAGYGESTTDGVYSGAALILKDGNILAENERFARESTLIVADLSEKGEPAPEFIPSYPGRHPFVPDDVAELALRCSEILSIQTTGLMSRLEHIHATRSVIGISGGLDSTLALLVCCNAFDRLDLDRKGIVAVTMPGFATSQRTRGNAWKLMESLGVDCREISITSAVRQHFTDIGHPEDVHDATYENAQARERTQILMDLSNQEGGLVVGTGDLSEIALGWCTYNGDHMSMYAVNCDVPKTMMQAMVRWAAENVFREVRDTLIDIVETPISPELLPNQITEDVVGPYELHDFFLYHFVREAMRPSEIRALAASEFEGIYDEAVIEKWLRIFIKRFFSQQFKRSCSADGPQVGTVCLSPRGSWNMPSDASPAVWLADLD